MIGKTAMDSEWSFLNLDGTKMKFADYPANKVASTQKPIKDYVVGVNIPGKNEPTWINVNAVPTFIEGDLENIIVIYFSIY